MLDWDEQSVLSGSQHSVAPATLLSYEEVKPQSRRGRRSSTRLQQYRRKLRRQRNRRIVLYIVTTAAFLAMGLTYKINHPGFNFQQFVPVEDLNVTVLDEMLDAAGNKTMNLLRIKKDEPKQMPKKTTKSKKVTPKPEKKATTPAEVQDPPPAGEKQNLKPTPPDPANPTNQLSVEKAKVQEPVEQQAQLTLTEKPKERRPPLCNIPLAYIHPRCRRLARSNPVFNLHDLVQDMMQ